MDNQTQGVIRRWKVTNTWCLLKEKIERVEREDRMARERLMWLFITGWNKTDADVVKSLDNLSDSLKTIQTEN